MPVILRCRVLYLLLVLVAAGMASNSAHAFFNCNIGGSRVRTEFPIVTVDAMVLYNTSSMQLFVDLGDYIFCAGLTGDGYNDALRVASDSGAFITGISPEMQSYGFESYLKTQDGSTNTAENNGAAGKCMWPPEGDSNCKRDSDPGSLSFSPMKGMVWFQRNDFSKSGTISAGTPLFYLSVEHRSEELWGDSYTRYLFVLASDLVIPAATCDIVAADMAKEVRLPPIAAASLDHNGATGPDTPFNIALTNCSGGPDIYITLTPNGGPGEYGIDDIGVLPNRIGENMAENVGVQVLVTKDGHLSVVKFREMFHVDHTDSNSYNIQMAARYYRTSESAIKSGAVSAALVYQMAYQ